MEGFLQCSANFIPLTPISFIERAATVYGEKTSIVYGTLSFSWKQTYQRCLKLASSLVKLGVNPGNIVATLAPNIPAVYELQFSVPMAGAVIAALNTKLDSITLALLLKQLEPKLFFVDYEYVDVILQAFNILSTENLIPPRLILIPEIEDSSMIINNLKSSLDYKFYNSLLELEEDDDDFEVKQPINEFDPISVNYTSGSTGIPKGAIYSHRAAYLNSIAGIFKFDMKQMPVFLWTVDMFRCNGWCLIWTMAALGGTNVCLRNVSSKVIFNSILLHKVTHLCGPPSILKILSSANGEHRQQWKVNVIVAGGFLDSKIVAKVQELGFRVSDGYGMTEVLGPTIVEPRKIESDDQQESRDKGLHNIFIEGDVKDPDTMKSVPNDGKTLGEIMFRSNILMSGYFKNLKATQLAFRGGWYHTADIGIKLENGSIQLKDRASDIIISDDGETISTLEVEITLLSHPKVLEAAVVGKVNDVLKEVPFAFVKLKDGFHAYANEIIEFCSAQLPKHMVPKGVVFGDIPVNFNGKVKKFLLREKAKTTISYLEG